MAATLPLAFALMLSVWSLLALGSMAALHSGSFAPTTLASIGAVLALSGTWRRRLLEQWEFSYRFAASLLVVFFAGYAFYPCLALLVSPLGRALGLTIPTLGETWTSAASYPVVATLVIAPLYEEPLYRGVLLAALGRRTGAIGAALVTSVLFALPHALPLLVLGSLLSGVLLAGVAQVSNSLGLCVALHLGLNVAALWHGPAFSREEQPLLWLSMAATGTIAAVVLCRGRGWRSPPSREGIGV